MNKSIEKHQLPVNTNPPPAGGGRWFFISRETVDQDGELKSIRRTFRHRGPSVTDLKLAFSAARPAERYLDKPRLAAKRRRAVERALRRGRRTQIEQAIGSYTGE